MLPTRLLRLLPLAGAAFAASLLLPGSPAAAQPPIPVGSYPWGVAVNPDINRVYVANSGDHTVSVINGDTNTVVKTVPIPGDTPWPNGVAVNPTTNLVYVANQVQTFVSVIDGATNTVIDSIPLGGIRDPYGIATNPVTNRIYVPSNIYNQVSVIDGATNAVIDTVDVDDGPYFLAVNPATNRIYVPNIDSGTVSVIDGVTHAVVPIPIAPHPFGVAVDPSTNQVYVTHYVTAGKVSVIDGATNTVIDTIDVGDHPSGVAVNAEAHRVYVANEMGDTLSLIDSTTNDVVDTVSAGDWPRGVAANPNTNRMYVTNYMSNTVSVIEDPGGPTLPTLHSPLPGSPTDSQRQGLWGFAAEWTHASCGDLPKLHVGKDLRATPGESVYAAASGTVRKIDSSGDNWGQYVTVEHGAFTTVYHHVVPVVSEWEPVTKGQVIAAIADIDDETPDHLHFGVRTSPNPEFSNRGALPQVNSTENIYCQNDPLFPEDFVDPMTLTYEPTPTDFDGDGISNQVDADPSTFSNDFTDVAIGGATSGQIVDRAGLALSVEEVANPSGVRATAKGTAGPAEVEACAAPVATYSLSPGNDFIVTCGSAMTEVRSGPVTAHLGTVIAILPTGTTGTVSEVTPGTYDATNSAGSEASIVVGGLTLAPGDLITGIIDADEDGLVNAVETDTGVFNGPSDTGTDPLIPDTDGDGLLDGDEVLLHATNPLVTDTDVDGCAEGEELEGAPAPKPGSTGPYDPLAWYDFYDVPVPAYSDPTPNGTRDHAVAMDDVLAVLFYVGTYEGDGGTPNANGVSYDVDKDGDTVKDGRAYDRSPSAGPNPPWGAGPPDAAVAMDDVLVVLAQVGLSCIEPP